MSSSPPVAVNELRAGDAVLGHAQTDLDKTARDQADAQNSVRYGLRVSAEVSDSLTAIALTYEPSFSSPALVLSPLSSARES